MTNNGAVKAATTKTGESASKLAEKAHEIAGPQAKKIGIKLRLISEEKTAWQKPSTYMAIASIFAVFAMTIRSVFGYKNSKNS